MFSVILNDKKNGREPISIKMHVCVFVTNIRCRDGTSISEGLTEFLTVYILKLFEFKQPVC